jgi:integrase
MEFVEPIRDRKKIESMKKILQGNDRDYLLFVLGINTAYRISDLLELKYKDVIDEKKKVLSHVKLKESKTDKNNKVAITKGVAKAITNFVENNYKGNLEEYLFVGKKNPNKPIRRETAWRIISSAAEEVGLKNIGTHTLRKTFAYHQYKAGTDIAILMDMLNHSSETITLKYIGITQDEKDRAVRALDL